VRNPRRTLPLLLSFIEVITHYHQHQREVKNDCQSGSDFIETTPEDIEWAFKLLRNVLFRKSDELSDACRKFYDWVGSPDRQLSKEGFYAREIREQSNIHPRTLNRYLNELTEFGRIRIMGGNKHKGGYQYQFTDYTRDHKLGDQLDQWMATTLQAITQAYEEATKRRKKSA